MTLNSVDICSGAGGLASGLSLSGFNSNLVCDVDFDSCATLEKNERKLCEASDQFEVERNDLKTLDFSRFEEKIDLLSGGPPCQPFSKGGKHNAHQDKRDLFPEAIRAVREIRPKVYLFENVSGMQRPNFGQYFEYLRLQLTHPDINILEDEHWTEHLRRLENHHLSGSTCGLNYRLIVHRLNAADYGVPQQRNRVFFVGFREELGVDWCFPSPTHSKSSLVSEMLDGTYWERNCVLKQHRKLPKRFSVKRNISEQIKLKPWKTLREAISDLEDFSLTEGVNKKKDHLHTFRPGARAYKGHTGSRMDEPAKTLKAGVHGVPGGENMFTDDHGNLRYFSLRECARIQTFPDTYQFCGSWSSVLKQMGNAVPVKLAETIGSSIAKSLHKSLERSYK